MTTTERGAKHNPKQATLVHVADLIGVAVADLIGVAVDELAAAR
jgi:hypothetical protein